MAKAPRCASNEYKVGCIEQEQIGMVVLMRTGIVLFMQPDIDTKT